MRPDSSDVQQGRKGGFPVPLTQEQEVDFARRIEAGLLAHDLLDRGPSSWTPTGATEAELRQLVAEGTQAWEVFFTHNHGLVVTAVREAVRVVDDDMVQQGYLALGEALMRFDVEYGTRFSTLAYAWVRKAVQVAHRRTHTLLTTPNGRLQAIATVSAVRADLAERGLCDSVAAVAGRLERPHDWVAQHWSRPERVLLDVSDLDEILEPQPVESRAEDWWFDHLPDMEATVLAARYGLRGHRFVTYARLADRLRIAQCEVRRLERVAMGHVRDLVLHGEFAGGGLLRAG